MSIVTLCRSCKTLSRSIGIDRCKYCGSQRIEVKSIEATAVGKIGNREFLVNEKEIRTPKRL